jgi:hypothetical protein
MLSMISVIGNSEQIQIKMRLQCDRLVAFEKLTSFARLHVRALKNRI